MKTQQEIEAEIARLVKEEKELFKRVRGIGTALATVCVVTRNDVRIATLKWVLNENV
jgi:hypothetical protein